MSNKTKVSKNLPIGISKLEPGKIFFLKKQKYIQNWPYDELGSETEYVLCLKINNDSIDLLNHNADFYSITKNKQFNFGFMDSVLCKLYAVE